MLVIPSELLTPVSEDGSSAPENVVVTTGEFTRTWKLPTAVSPSTKRTTWTLVDPVAGGLEYVFDPETVYPVPLLWIWPAELWPSPQVMTALYELAVRPAYVSVKEATVPVNGGLGVGVIARPVIIILVSATTAVP
jgi:hypothetical protein